MRTLLILAATVFSDYPGLVRPGNDVEARIDRGLLVEFVVRCPGGTGIVSYSRGDHCYADSRLRCHATLSAARSAVCGRH